MNITGDNDGGDYSREDAGGRSSSPRGTGGYHSIDDDDKSDLGYSKVLIETFLPLFRVSSH